LNKSHRDQRGRQHSGKKCPESAAGGCVYCRTGSYKRQDRRTRRQKAKSALRREPTD